MGARRHELASSLMVGLPLAALWSCAEADDSADPPVQPVGGPMEIAGQSPERRPTRPSSDSAKRDVTCDRSEATTALRPDQATRAAWLDQSYPIAHSRGGDRAESDRFRMHVAVRPDRWFTLTGCNEALEADVDIELHDQQGMLFASGQGVVRLGAMQLQKPPPNELYERQARLEAELSLANAGAGRAAPRALDATPARVRLFASLTPFGSAGRLSTAPAPATRRNLDDGATPTAPPDEPLLRWPEADACASGEQALVPGDGPEMRGLRDALTALGASAAPVYESSEDGPEKIGSLSISVMQPQVLCGSRLPTTAVLAVTGTDMEVLADVAIHTVAAMGELQLGTNYEVPYVFAPELFRQRLGSVGLELSPYTFAGIELWLQYDSAPNGELRVVTWTGDDCLLCDLGACSECSEADKVVTRLLSIGAQEGP